MRPPRWDLYLEAITHSSYASEYGGKHNERLEFMGDAVLQLCASELLFARFPHASEGELSSRRRVVVNNAFLADVARELRLGEVLRLGRGEAATGGRQRETVLSCVLEALLGAIFLDQGLDAVRPVVQSIVDRSPQDGEEPRDPKVALQEWVQQTYPPPNVPVYTVLEGSGPDHARTFRTAVSIQGEVIAEGEGSSKRRASQAAAVAAIQILQAAGRM